MTDFRITIYSGPGTNDSDGGYGPEVSSRVVGARQVADVLNQYGREWRTADYMGARQVVIVVDPVGAAGESVVYDGAFPLSFLRDEHVYSEDGGKSIVIEPKVGPGAITVRMGQTVVRDEDGSLSVEETQRGGSDAER